MEQDPRLRGALGQVLTAMYFNNTSRRHDVLNAVVPVINLIEDRIVDKLINRMDKERLRADSY